MCIRDREWTAQCLHDSLMALIAECGIKNGQMLWPMRTALSGWEVTPGGAMEIADILGRDESLRRIRTGIDRLTAVVIQSPAAFMKNLQGIHEESWIPFIDPP